MDQETRLAELRVALGDAESRLAPLDAALDKALAAKEKAATKVEEAKAAALDAGSARDVVRLEVMAIQNEMAGLLIAAGMQAPTQGIVNN